MTQSVSKIRATSVISHQNSIYPATAGGSSSLDIDKLDVVNIGWQNLEQKYTDLKGMLSAPTTGLNANQARLNQKQTVTVAIITLLNCAQKECCRLLNDGRAKEAVKGGLKTLKLKEDYYGQGSLHLVPVYFHLARTNQFIDNFKAAEEFLSLAQWIIVRDPEADVSLKAELHQTFGLLYASDSKLDAALKQLTCATYYLSIMHGPEHILTSYSYFDIGNVFAAQTNMENAMAFYEKVKDIWYTHLTNVLQQRLKNEDTDMPYGTPKQIGEENMQDTTKMLQGIIDLQTERFGMLHPVTCRAEYIFGMFFLFSYDIISGQQYIMRALEIAKRVYGARHAYTLDIRGMLTQHRIDIPDEDTSYLLEQKSNEV
eukprot:Tbor_TRINITY_DN3535_c0_g1::TRINITY_DN3535_c0_g1_i1::g.2920::m.2920